MSPPLRAFCFCFLFTFVHLSPFFTPFGIRSPLAPETEPLVHPLVETTLPSALRFFFLLLLALPSAVHKVNFSEVRHRGRSFSCDGPPFPFCSPLRSYVFSIRFQKKPASTAYHAAGIVSRTSRSRYKFFSLVTPSRVYDAHATFYFSEGGRDALPVP